MSSCIVKMRAHPHIYTHTHIRADTAPTHCAGQPPIMTVSLALLMLCKGEAQARTHSYSRKGRVASTSVIEPALVYIIAAKTSELEEGEHRRLSRDGRRSERPRASVLVLWLLQLAFPPFCVLCSAGASTSTIPRVLHTHAITQNLLLHTPNTVFGLLYMSLGPLNTLEGKGVLAHALHFSPVGPPYRQEILLQLREHCRL